MRASDRAGPTPPFPRRHLRQGVQAGWKVRACLLVAATTSGLLTSGSATGVPVADRILRGGLAGALTASAAAAPSWAVVVLATGAAGLGLTAGPLGAGAGLLALVLSAVTVLDAGRRVDRSLVQAAAGALSATALLRIPGGPLGATAAASAVLSCVVVAASARTVPRPWRRRGGLAAIALVVLAGVAIGLGAAAGVLARASFQRSADQTAKALAAARAGDAAGAAAGARSAGADLAEARSVLGAWWVQPAWALPIIGAHLRAGDEIARSAAPAVDAAASSAEVLRLDALRPQAGRLDLDRLAAAEPELVRLSTTLHAAQRGAARARSPWLVAPLQERLARYDAELASITGASDRAVLAVQALPRLLGGDRPARWFIAVGTPAESRELGGCVCDYAVVTADRGALRLERSGAVQEIGSYQTGRTLAGLDLPNRYLGQQPEVYWQNLSGYPDLPTVALAARKLWDQVAPGSPLDGVAYVDPHGLAALLQLTGPVAVPTPFERLSADNAVQLLLRDQYAQFSANDQRKGALDEAAGAVFKALSAAALPAPAAMGDALAPAVRGGHLLATSFDAVGQRLFDAIEASGRLPPSDGGDLASLRTSNRAENKLDAYLRRSVRYHVTVDPEAGRVDATASIELRNEATADLPEYVAGNRRGLPKGTNILAAAWYSGLPLEGVEVDGRPVAVDSVLERGWWTHTVNLTVSPGGTASIKFRLSGGLAATRPYRLAVAPQAAAHDDRYTVEVFAIAGWVAAPVPAPEPGRGRRLVVPLRER